MIEIWHLWVIAGLVLWIVEIFTPGFVVGVFGTACLIVAPFAGSAISIKIQLLIFGIATAIIFFGIRPFIIRYFYNRETNLKTNAEALIGKSGIVVEAIDNISGSGRARIGGEVWRAITTDNSLVDVGKRIIVREIDGCKLVVEVGIETTQQGGTNQ
ncbi:MAG TPA: NfeD family protein [Syntrophales bacterium]|nr:NfeD family protein [Syntrophales bacterium]